MTNLRLAGAASAVAALIVIPLLFSSAAQAHAVCGARIFPATQLLDDPGVGDEFVPAHVEYAPTPSAGGGGDSTAIGFAWAKTITENFGLQVSSGYDIVHNAGATTKGFEDVNLEAKYKLFCADKYEFISSVAVSRDFQKTGSAGITSPVGATTVSGYFGKGFGDLPIGPLRAFAITGELDYSVSDSPNASPNAWTYSGSLQYSIPYLQQNVKDYGLPPVIGNLTPVVEVSFNTPDNQPTTGQIATGLLYNADTWQVSLEATFPATKATWTTVQGGTGVIAELHFFLDDIFPNTLGKPLF